MLELASFWKGTSTKSWMHLAGLHPWTTGFPHWGRAAWHCHHGICFHTVHRLHAMMMTVSHLASPIHTWFQLILSCIPLSPLNNTQRKLILASQERKNLYVIDNVQIQREKKKNPHLILLAAHPDSQGRLSLISCRKGNKEEWIKVKWPVVESHWVMERPRL